jgi:hypothetical protein
LSQEVANLILPFAVASKERKITFTKEMEIATIFYMAESDRKKGEGILLKKPQEEMLFTGQFWYPIWLIPWKGRRLLFDGLGVTQRTLTYYVLPEIKTFTTDVEDTAENFEAYSAALADHIHYFTSALREEEKTILGLITNSDLIEDFSSYLSEAEQSEIKNTWLYPVVDESSISVSLNDLTELKTALDRDVDNLRYSMKLLNAATRKHVEVIRESTQEIKKDFNEKIEVEKALAMEKVREIQKINDERITKSSKNFERQLQKLHQERAQLEKSADRAITQIDRCEAEIENAKNRKDKAVQQRWKQEMENWRREAKALQKSIEQLDKRIEETESEKRIEISNLRSEFGVQSENAMKNVRELEASRDAKVQLNQQKIKSLEESTSTIVAQLDNLVKQKRVSLNEIDKMGMNTHKKSAIAYVPFYLACFQADEEKRRYVVYPPSVAGTVGVLTKLKGVLGISKVKSLFQPRSKEIANILDQVVTVIERDPVFKRDLQDVGVKANILQSEENREMVKRGLEELRREEWISENEFQTLSQSLINA